MLDKLITFIFILFLGYMIAGLSSAAKQQKAKKKKSKEDHFIKNDTLRSLLWVPLIFAVVFVIVNMAMNPDQR